MKSFFALLLVTLFSGVLFLGSTAGLSGCNFACTEVGCPNGADNSASINIKGFVAKYGAVDLLTMKACSTRTCVAATVVPVKGVLMCFTNDPNGTCVVTAQDATVSLVLDEDEVDQHTLPLTLSIYDDNNAVVFEGKQTATVSKYEPNHDCGQTCRYAEANFTP